MSKVEIDPVCKRRIQPQAFARNGSLVSAQYQADLAELANQIARYRTPECFRGGGDVANLADTTLSANKIFRFAGHISPMAGSIVARLFMAPAIQSTQTNNPHVTLTLYDTSGNVVGGGSNVRGHFGYGHNATPTEAPSEWGSTTIAINVSAHRDTSFRAVLQAHDDARMISCTVYQVALDADTDNGYVNQSYSVGQPILDEDRQKIQDLAVALYKRGMGPLFNFSSYQDALAPDDFSTIYQNISRIHFSSTMDDPAGYRLDPRFMNRKTTTTVPVKFECYAGMDAAGSGNVRVSDTAGNVYATFTISGQAQWQTPILASLPADQRMYVIEQKGDGADSVTTYALSCYRYMA